MHQFTTISNYHNNLVTGKTTCEKTVLFYLKRIEQESHLNVFLEVFKEEALQRAKYLDELYKKEKKMRKLHGVVFSLKDVLCYENHICSASSKMLEHFVSLYSATAVKNLLEEGAIIIGRVNCDEFAMGNSNENSAFKPVLNYADNTKVPGGSSGGSAVSVQANLCMISLGSDTGGSVRQPADFCGVIGYKPSYGRVSRLGLISYASSFDCIGIFASSIENVAITLEVIAGYDNWDTTATTLPVEKYSNFKKIDKPLQIGYFSETLTHSTLDDEIKNKIELYLQKLQTKGYRIKPISFKMIDYIVPAYYILATAEASSNLARYNGVHFGYRTNKTSHSIDEMIQFSRQEGFGKEVQKRILLGTFVLSASYYASYYAKAQKIRNKLIQETKEMFLNFDCIISPTTPTTAFELNKSFANSAEVYLADLFTVYANLVGIPAMSIPIFKHSNGMPFGLQIMADNYKDADLLSIANNFFKQ